MSETPSPMSIVGQLVVRWIDAADDVAGDADPDRSGLAPDVRRVAEELDS
jgi:hypothetical protein